MKAQGQFQSLLRCVFYALVLLATGCGGGGSAPGGDQNPNKSTDPVSVHADAGDIIGVRVNEKVILDGSASSTTLSDPLTFAWSFSHKPDASKAQLFNTKSAHPSFTADVEGTYMVQLVVSAGGISSRRAIAFVEVTTSGNVTGTRVHTSFPSQCANCHDGRYANGVGPIDPVPPKSPNHLATSNMCEACHTTFGFKLIRFVDHVEVFGNCSSCHNGVLATPKSKFHIATTAECDKCHNTTSFLKLGPDGKYDHTDITTNCTRCHNGTTAKGKYDGHFATTTDCHYCHNTINFKDAYVDHSTITGNCASCHNGTDARGPKTGHPAMAVDCGICHSITGFNMGGVYNHRLVDSATQACAVCHNDNNSIGARGKAAALNHLPTTKDCGICHGVGGGNFANGIYDHTGIVSGCGQSGCHDPASKEGIYAAGNTHVPSNGNDCEICHTPGDFATGVFDHTAVESDMSIRCDSCHNDMITAGKDFDHVPTIEDCRVCHTGTTTFAGAVFVHTGITSGCATCHDGTISKGKSLNHMPTTQDCSVCHVIKFDNFTGGNFDHLVGVSNNCATCHDGVIAKGKTLDHIPSLQECSQCHTDTSIGGFINSIFLTDVHPGLATGCEGCHNSKFLSAKPALLKAATHVPTSQDCHSCHSNVNFADKTFFTHADISGNCESCHNGDYLAAGALGKASDPTPPHPATTADCGICHGIGASFADGVFDHTGRVSNCAECHGDGKPGAVTKKHADHVPTTQDCSICHVPGTFKTAVFNHQGIVNNCASCHDGSVATATVKSSKHLPTTKDCSVCHNTTAFAGAKFDHQGIVSNCALCHDGIIAKGKHSNHVPTNDDCSVCHQTTGFKPGTFAHVGIVDNCQSCHNGVFAQDKKAGHVATTQDCGLCHTTRGFKPAIVDHANITSTMRCDSCHVDGSTSITGKDDKVNPPHWTTSRDCRVCHTTTSFIGATWLHEASAAGMCDTCHSTAGGARAQPTKGHFVTTVQCDSCHDTNGWSPASTFDHCAGKTTSKTGTCSGSDYPGNHRRTLACLDCHANNTDIPTYSTPFDKVTPVPNKLYPDCAGCHRDDFERQGDHIGGSNGTVLQNKDCSGGGSGCHKVTSSGF